MAGQKARARSGRTRDGRVRTSGGSRNQTGGRNPARTTGGGRSGTDRPGAKQAGTPRPGQQGRRPATAPGSAPLAANGQAAQTALPQPPSPWFQMATLVLALAGLGVSVYLTIAHYTSTSVLACSDKGVVNCAKVTTSPESTVFGVFPVAVLGLAFYVFMVAAASPWAWRSRLPAVAWIRIAGIVTGMGFVLYLIYAEVIQIGKVCLWCTAVHAITFVLFALLVFDAVMRGAGTGNKPSPSPSRMR